MTKHEFLAILQESLEGNIPQQELMDDLRYYQEYFEGSGRSQEEVCEELGDPRLIARSIIDSFRASKGPMADYYTRQAREEYQNTSRKEQRAYDGADRVEEGSFARGLRYAIWIGAGILCVVVCIFALGVMLRIFLPILLLLLIFWFLFRLLTDFF